jgi:hypothetical protein
MVHVDASMQHAQYARIHQSAQHVRHRPTPPRRGQRTLPAQLRKRGALDELRCHDQVPVEFQCVVESHNVRMRQARVDLNLAEKPLQRFRIAVRRSRQRPQHLKLTRRQISNLVSNSCRGLIHYSKELIVANGLTGFGHSLHTQSTAILRWHVAVSQFPFLERMGPNYS